MFHMQVLKEWFYSHVICSGTKMQTLEVIQGPRFYSHVICSGTKIVLVGI